VKREEWSVNYEQWVVTVPEEIRGDSLWKMEAYRLALFAADIGWYDVTGLMQDRRTLGLADQLYRALGSISANLAEGYSRGTGRDRAHFYEYSLGSARESRDWYYKARHILKAEVSTHRLEFLTQIIRLLLTMIPQQRERVLREEAADYSVDLAVAASRTVSAPDRLSTLLQDVPVP
jgi:four helix bundle protein